MYISYEATEEAAEAFLKKHHPGREIPVPIGHIVEITLGISIIPRRGLLNQDGVDAFLSHDFTELYIDYDQYMGTTNRSRFTLAHEMGHLVLHQEIVSKIQSLEDWRKFILGEGTGRAYLEIHADNFAGCLLMPRPEVETEYRAQKAVAVKKLEAAGMSKPDDKMLISFIANEIARKFDVSPKAAEVRLSKILL